MKNLTLFAAFVILVASGSGCAHRQSSTTNVTTSTQGDASAPAPDASPNADAAATNDAPANGEAAANADAPAGDAGPAQGHIETTGAVAIARDFKIGQCVIGKPGEGLLNGYQMHSESPEGDHNLISVRASDYTKDGTYNIAPQSAEAQAGQMMNAPGAGALQLMLAGKTDEQFTALTATPKSTVEITIGGNGSKGEAKFTKYQNLMGAMSVKMSEKAGAKSEMSDLALVDGSITWSCGKVDHLAGAMSDAVNGMFKGLMDGKKR